MAGNQSLFELGQTINGTNSFTGEKVHTNLLGQVQSFDNYNYDEAGPDQRVRVSGSKIRAVILRNDSGGTLGAARWVRFKPDATPIADRAHVVSALATEKGHFPYILVDPFLANPVPDGHLFYGIISGIVPVITNATPAVGSLLLPATGGGSANPSSGDEWAAVATLLELGVASQRKLAAVNCHRLPFDTI